MVDRSSDPLTALIIAGGEPSGLGVDALPEHRLVIAADSGLDQARQMGLAVDRLVGDLDSVSALGLAWARAHGVVIDQHDADKDATDLELALHVAVAEGAGRIVVVGGLGGRLDHLLATLALIAAPTFARCAVELRTADERVLVVRPGMPAVIEASVGATVTLLAAGGPAGGVTTDALRWPLADATLVPGSTLGVSNEVVRSPASVRVSSGALLAILSAHA